VSAGILGKRYASALMSLASQAGTVEHVRKDLADFAATWKESRELRNVFENPGVSSQARRAVLKDIAAQTSMHDHVRDTLQLLADRSRMRYVPDVADAFEAMAEARSGKVRAEVVSASPLPEAYYNELTQALKQVTGKDVVIVRKTDPTLIGGVVARVGDRILDGSLKHRLSELKTELLNSSSGG